MKILMPFALMFCPLLVSAAPSPTTIYYSGTAQILNLFSGQQTTEKLIMKRVVDPTNSTIVELACGQTPGKPTFQSPMYLTISGNQVKLSDTTGAPNKVSGTGTVHGQPWNWNYLEFSMTYHSPQGDSKITDVNFLASNMIVARKQIFTASGIPVELYDINMVELSQTDYQALYDSMGCGTAAQ